MERSNDRTHGAASTLRSRSGRISWYVRWIRAVLQRQDLIEPFGYVQWASRHGYRHFKVTTQLIPGRTHLWAKLRGMQEVAEDRTCKVGRIRSAIARLSAGNLTKKSCPPAIALVRSISYSRMAMFVSRFVCALTRKPGVNLSCSVVRQANYTLDDMRLRWGMSDEKMMTLAIDQPGYGGELYTRRIEVD